MSLTLTIVEENGLTVTDDRVVITVGASGPQGATGAAGVGVPAGGTTGQVLAKVSATNYDTQWVTGGGGSGDVVGPSSSVDGRAVLFDGTTGKLIKQATAAPVLEGDARLTDARTPTAHAASHQDGGSDELALDASQTTSGVFNVARLGTGTPTGFTFLDGTGAWTDNVPVYVPVKNTSGSQITKGAPVYATGTVGATYVIEVSPADADVAAAMPALGLLESTLAVNATGYAVVTGTLRGVDTNAYSVGQQLYVSTTAGQLTSTKPTGSTAEVQSIGVVTRVNANSGEILVGIGNVVDSPNSGIDGGAITTGTVGFARLPTGTTSSTVAAGDDSRLSDARVPQWRRLTFSNADYNLGSAPSPAVSGSTVLQQTGTLSAARTVTLPAASAVPAGGEVIVNAGAGASSTNTVTIQRAGSDTINGATASLVIGTAWGQRRLVSDGVSAWSHDDGLVRRSANLSDLASASTARTNLGLATIASSGSASDLSTGTVALARLSTTAAPTATPFTTDDWVPLWTGWGAGTGTTTLGGTASASNGAVRYQPIWIGQTVNVTGLGIDVSTANAGASAVVRLGIYANASGRPGTVVVDAGTASLNTAVGKELTFTSTQLTTGWYWLALATQNLDTAGSNPAVRAVVSGTSLSPRTSVPSNTASQNAQLSSTGITGAFAATPSVSIVTSNVLAMLIWGKFA